MAVYREKYREQIRSKERENYKNNREQKIQKAKAYYQKIKGTKGARQRSTTRTNYQQHKITSEIAEIAYAKWQKSHKDRVAKLETSYVRQLIASGSNLKSSDIPEELVEVKRLQLQLKRELQERK